MTPAPGPLSPPAEERGPPIYTDAGGAHLEPSTSSSARMRSRDRLSARPGITSEDHGMGLAGGPKVCVQCGRLLDVNEEEIAPTMSSLATAPSPSSIAFATHTSRSEQGAPQSITTMLANTPTTMETSQEAHSMCSSCATSAVGATHNQDVRPVRGEMEHGASTSRTSGQDQHGDSIMSYAASASTSATETATVPSTPPRSDLPWRAVTAPWANMARRDRSDSRSVDGLALTISVGNMGAGGDAVAMETDDHLDFPPLARSPGSHGQLGATATSPRLPLSPSRGRSGGLANATSSPPPPLGRHPSFSRSQSAALAGSVAAVAPVVNFPARGRHRTGSQSSVTVVPNVGAGRGRRPSATRRLSRSSSSTGPTATSFADLVADMVPSGSAVAEDGFLATPIAEDPFGPAQMTRPRLSTIDVMTDSQTIVPVDMAPDALHKPLPRSVKEREQENSSKTQRRIDAWLNLHRPDSRPQISLQRCKSQGRGCLFPGATFRGTQKSGRMSYDVSVQIVNVDLAESHLCGYLNIRGLTDDWPELTTYFDAEIIGQRYGFLTGKWGASEADDMKHWSRFTPFRPMRNSLTRPGLKFNHMNKPFIFMRWKERFLVPDHRVRDINGASFAGFYYVCVELGDEYDGPHPASLTSPSSPVTSPGVPPLAGAATGMTGRGAATVATVAPMDEMEGLSTSSPLLPSGDYLSHPAASSVQRPRAPTSGRMSGFYFHEHSEPYQQLTLRHVAESSTSSFEMR